MGHAGIGWVIQGVGLGRLGLPFGRYAVIRLFHY